MTFRDKIPSATAQASSREESIAILDRYRDDLSMEEYGWIYSSIATHAIEGMYLGEREIVVAAAHLRDEITADEILQLARKAA
jgi:hypothetical protein